MNRFDAGQAPGLSPAHPHPHALPRGSFVLETSWGGGGRLGETSGAVVSGALVRDPSRGAGVTAACCARRDFVRHLHGAVGPARPGCFFPSQAGALSWATATLHQGLSARSASTSLPAFLPSERRRPGSSQWSVFRLPPWPGLRLRALRYTQCPVPRGRHCVLAWEPEAGAQVRPWCPCPSMGAGPAASWHFLGLLPPGPSST